MASGAGVLLALAVAGAGAVSAAGAILVVALGLGLYARHWLSLAGRSGVGARSEDEVRRALAPLQADGWRLRHSLPWQGRGDIDSLAIAPTGVGVRDRDQDEGVRRSSSRACVRPGGMAVSPASAVVSARGGAGGLPGSRTRCPAA